MSFDSGNNHALVKPSNQSSIADFQDASFGNDGSIYTRSCSSYCSVTEQEWDPWYTVDLERPYLINAVNIYTCHDDIADISKSYFYLMENFH